MIPTDDCCCIPTVVTPSGCNMSGCTQSATNGTGMSLDSNPYGGSATLSTDASYGRPAPGFKLAATQTGGSGGTYSVVLFPTALTLAMKCIDKTSTICGEFLHTYSGTKLRVWACLVQSGNVFVRGASNYTDITDGTTWTAVTDTFGWDRLYKQVTAYGSSSITTGSDIDDAIGAADVYAGFLIQSQGTDGVEYDSYLDNVCLKVVRAVPCDPGVEFVVTFPNYPSTPVTAGTGRFGCAWQQGAVDWAHAFLSSAIVLRNDGEYTPGVDTACKWRAVSDYYTGTVSGGECLSNESLQLEVFIIFSRAGNLTGLDGNVGLTVALHSTQEFHETTCGGTGAAGKKSTEAYFYGTVSDTPCYGGATSFTLDGISVSSVTGGSICDWDPAGLIDWDPASDTCDIDIV